MTTPLRPSSLVDRPDRPSYLVRNPARPAATFPGWGPKIGL
jgi:hypothetical protein